MYLNSDGQVCDPHVDGIGIPRVGRWHIFHHILNHSSCSSSPLYVCLLLIMLHMCEVQGNIDALVQDNSISIAYALEILPSCTKPSIYTWRYPTLLRRLWISVLFPAYFYALRTLFLLVDHLVKSIKQGSISVCSGHCIDLVVLSIICRPECQSCIVLLSRLN